MIFKEGDKVTITGTVLYYDGIDDYYLVDYGDKLMIWVHKDDLKLAETEEQKLARKVKEENDSYSDSAVNESLHYWTGVPSFDRATFEKMKRNVS